VAIVKFSGNTTNSENKPKESIGFGYSMKDCQTHLGRNVKVKTTQWPRFRAVWPRDLIVL